MWRRTLVLLIHITGVVGFSILPGKSSSPTTLFASNVNEINPLKPGSTVALITPFDENGGIDFQGLRSLLQYHVQADTDNLCILGTTAEASVMSMDERQQVLQVAVDECKGRLPIIAGVGTINPASIKTMTLQAMDMGCDAALVVTPYYVKPPQRCLIDHFTTCADYGLPVVVYNVPSRTGIDFLDENIAIVAQHDNIVALKDATGNLDRITNMRRLVDDDFLIYSGDDGTSADFLLKGGDGCISVTANLVAKQMHDMCAAARAGDTEKVYAINEPLERLHSDLFCESNPIPTKWAARRIGMIETAYCRPPLAEMDPQFIPRIEDALRAAGLL